MDFTLTSDQSDLRAGAREFLADACPPALVRARYDDPAAVPQGLLTALAEQGWAGVGIAEEHGGLGRGAVELCLVLEEAGRVLAPVPLWETVGLFVPLVQALGSPQQQAEMLGRVAAGDLLGSAAIAEADGRWRGAPGETRAEAAGDGWRLTGRKSLVPEAGAVGALVVTAVADDGPAAFVVDPSAVETRINTTVDGGRALYDVTLDGVPATRLDGAAAFTDGMESALDVATVTLAAELLGAARWILDTTVGYTKVRVQFDVPIGSFQAVQHILADGLVELERAWAGVYWAAMCVDAGDPDRTRAAAVAKASAGDAARRIAKDGIQLHGGIGYTWEHDLHLYIRRIYADEPLLGGAGEQRDRIADLLAL